MNLLLALHGTAAAVVICCLLFVDETGVPLPFAPNELLLLFTGVLIAGGQLPLVVIVPAEYIAMAAGMIVGYSWARAAGQTGLQSLATRFKADRMSFRVKTQHGASCRPT